MHYKISKKYRFTQHKLEGGIFDKKTRFAHFVGIFKGTVNNSNGKYLSITCKVGEKETVLLVGSS